MMPRDLALAVLNRADSSQGFQERYLETSFEENPGLSERDRAFIVHLVQGVLRWQIRLDWIVKQAVRFPFKNIEPPTLNILRIALYQIFFMDRVPESAAVNEAVKQAKGACNKHVAGFVNGILRHICREKDRISFPDPDRERVLYLSVSYSYPLWLVEKWISELGPDAAERLLDAGNRIPNTVIRGNTLKTDRQGLLERLNEEGVTGTTSLYSPEGVTLEGLKGPVHRLRAFKEGLFQVQGEAAQIGSYLLSPRPGDSVLDVCAGLGGKSTHLAAIMEDKGFILALDKTRSRLISLLQSSIRLGTGSVKPVVADARGSLTTFLKHPFDKILLDGPCSGLGVISKNPDIKLTKRVGDIKRLARLQTTILNQAVHLLKREGKMLYLTCTISKDENEGVVEGFLEANGEMALENLKSTIPEWGLDLIDDSGFFRTLPHIHGMEGFFGALFRRR